MSKACDRCKKPKGKYGAKIKYSGLIKKLKEFHAFCLARRLGEPTHDIVGYYGTLDLCESCNNDFHDFMEEEQNDN